MVSKKLPMNPDGSDEVENKENAVEIVKKSEIMKTKRSAIFIMPRTLSNIIRSIFKSCLNMIQMSRKLTRQIILGVSRKLDRTLKQYFYKVLVPYHTVWKI